MSLAASSPTPRPAGQKAGQTAGRAALALGTTLALLIVVAAFAFRLQFYRGALGAGANPGFVDFDLFRMIGHLGLTGHIADAYDAAKLGALQKAAGGEAQNWAYPPPFDLVTLALAALSPALGYALFIGGSGLAYLWVLWRLSGGRPGLAMIVALPALVVVVMGGQNGLLTGTLAGLFALLALAGRRLAGLPLGLMVMKPHLGLGLGLVALARRRWGLLGLAFGVALAACALATAVFGPGVWPAFLTGLHTTSATLKSDGFHLIRLISVFASLRAAGLPVGLALAGQLGAALIGAGVLLWAVRRRLGPRAEIGLALGVTLMMSPYGFDYDMPIFGVAIATLLPELARRIRRPEAAALLALGWIACGSSLGLILSGLAQGRGLMQTEALVRAGQIPQLAGPAVLIAVLWAAWILARAPEAGR